MSDLIFVGTWLIGCFAVGFIVIGIFAALVELAASRLRQADPDDDEERAA